MQISSFVTHQIPCLSRNSIVRFFVFLFILYQLFLFRHQLLKHSCTSRMADSATNTTAAKNVKCEWEITFSSNHYVNSPILVFGKTHTHSSIRTALRWHRHTMFLSLIFIPSHLTSHRILFVSSPSINLYQQCEHFDWKQFRLFHYFMVSIEIIFHLKSVATACPPLI